MVFEKPCEFHRRPKIKIAMSVDTINIIAYLLLAVLAAVIIAGFVGIIKLIIFWCEMRAWRKWRKGK